MCASYGLGGGTGGAVPFEAFDEVEGSRLLQDWVREHAGRAKITGRRAHNLNPVIRDQGAGVELQLGWWWIWPGPGGPAKFDAFNARVERLTESRAWKGPFQRRALLPATWYVEKGRTFGLPGGEAFGIAAITNTVTLPDGSDLLTYAMVTRAAVGEAADTHPRMPLVLPEEAHREWLDPERPGDDALVTSAESVSEELSFAMTVEADQLF